MGSMIALCYHKNFCASLTTILTHRDINIKYTGLRPGEKLYEEKLMAEEGPRKTPILVNENNCCLID